MKIKHRILLYISTTVIPIIAIAFIFIYLLFAAYREEEFQQQQNEKIKSSLKLIEQFKDHSAEISFFLDEQDINDFYDEKLLVFNEEKKEIFASLDDLDISKVNSILNNLSPSTPWIETKEDDYDLIGVCIERNEEIYYAISKAYDVYGYTKLFFLRNTLIVIFLLIAIVIVLVSIYIAKMIALPITKLESEINHYELDTKNNLPISLQTSTIEINSLNERFNELLMHTNEVFKFQKHTINHISHQLKTPISVLVTELEKIQNASKEEEIAQQINQQKIKAKTLGSIINTLLEISKNDAGQAVEKQTQRVDELIFDCIHELNIIYPQFNFEVNYFPTDMEERYLLVNINPILMKQAFSNLLSNAVNYSSENKAEINFTALPPRQLKIEFNNKGKPISQEEKSFLFNHFFRGKNSIHKEGQGLGLILTKKIIELHDTEISYSNKNDLNTFAIIFHLRPEKS